MCGGAGEYQALVSADSDEVRATPCFVCGGSGFEQPFNHRMVTDSKKALDKAVARLEHHLAEMKKRREAGGLK